MILGICSIGIMCIPYLGILAPACGIVGLVMATMANNKAKAAGVSEQWDGKGMASAGLICSIIGLALFAIIVILVVVAASTLASMGLSYLNFNWR
jgi:hypothetical protein